MVVAYKAHQSTAEGQAKLLAHIHWEAKSLPPFANKHVCHLNIELATP